MRSHFLHLILYSALVGAFFGGLLKRRLKDQVKLGALIGFAMVGGAMALAFLMYPFPD